MSEMKIEKGSKTILLLGDSRRQGYEPLVRQMLEG